MRSLSGRWPLAVAALIVAAATGAAVHGGATTVMPLSDTQLADGADLILRGTVVEIRGVEYDTHPGVFTEVRVDVAERLDGQVTPALVLIRVPGGRTDDRHVVVPGMPSFQAGEEVVLFLESLPTAPFGDAEPAFIPFGLEQGVWRRSDEGWMRGAQEGLLPSVDTPTVHPLTLDALRELGR